jgi:hypothetical protein
LHPLNPTNIPRHASNDPSLTGSNKQKKKAAVKTSGDGGKNKRAVSGGSGNHQLKNSHDSITVMTV